VHIYLVIFAIASLFAYCKNPLIISVVFWPQLDRFVKYIAPLSPNQPWMGEVGESPDPKSLDASQVEQLSSRMQSELLSLSNKLNSLAQDMASTKELLSRPSLSKEEVSSMMASQVLLILP
jgi:hypothetical protein